MKILSLLLKITICFVFSICLSLNLVTGKAWALGQFSATCKNVSVSSNTELPTLAEPSLSALCQKNDGTYVQTSIKLNSYVGTNLNGVLSWGKNNLATRCYDLNILDNSQLNATCFDLSQRNSKDITTSIDLNEHIVNIDGQLQYE